MNQSCATNNHTNRARVLSRVAQHVRAGWMHPVSLHVYIDALCVARSLVLRS